MKKSKYLYISMERTEKVLGFIYLAFSLFVLPWLLNFINGYLANPLDDALLNFVFYTVNFFSVVCIFRRFLKNSLVAAWRDLWNFIQAVILGYVAYWASSRLFDWGMSYLFPDFTNVNDAAISAMAGNSYILIAVAVIGLVPLAEEVFYRGLIFRNLYQSSKLAAYLVSMAVFAAIHVLGYLGSESVGALVLCFLQYLPAGLCLAWTYTKADNIFASIVVHAVINAIAIGALR